MQRASLGLMGVSALHVESGSRPSIFHKTMDTQGQKVQTQTGSMLSVLQQRVETQAQMKARQWPASLPGIESSKTPNQMVFLAAPSSTAEERLC